MQRNNPPANKRTWLIIFGALVWSVVIYGFLTFLLSQNPVSRPNPANAAPLRPFVYGAALLALIGAAAYLHFTTYGKIGGEGRAPTLSGEQFQTHSIIALALSEACSIIGLVLFFLGAPMQEFFGFAAATIVLDLVFILPRGLSFWANWEKQERS